MHKLCTLLSDHALHFTKPSASSRRCSISLHIAKPAGRLKAQMLCTLQSQLQCKENPIYVLLFWKLHGLSPNFHIHVSVSVLYIPRIGPHISCSKIGRSVVGIYKSLTDT
jgi:hypothetical protein